jgi:hypothetical protein
MRYLNGLQKLIRSRSMYSLTRVTETVLTCSCAYGRVLEPSFLVDPEFCDMNDQQSSYYRVNCVTDLDSNVGPVVRIFCHKKLLFF